MVDLEYRKLAIQKWQIMLCSYMNQLIVHKLLKEAVIPKYHIPISTFGLKQC